MKGSIFSNCYILQSIIIIIITLLLASSANAVVHSIINDEEALLALKDYITIDPNQILAKNWSAGSPVCEWIGVICGKRHYRVTALDISSMGLTGTIVPHLGNLSFLVSLNLSDNNFHGDIPHELGHLRRLKWFDMSVNVLTGEIPSSVSFLNQLEYLYMYNNSLTGSIPSSIANMTNLKYLFLSNNGFTGSIPFGIFTNSSLQILHLPFNHLSGSLPTSMCSHIQELKQIELAYNMLSGPLPSQLSQCSRLRSLGMSYNNISGPIPKEFWRLKMLAAALFQHNNLEGTIPKDIRNLTSLRILNLADNRLTGTIPKEISNLTNLVQLNVANNYLTGTIPEELGSLQNPELLGLGFNGLSGLVPPGIFNISTLKVLFLSGNNLSGSLPSTTGCRLPNLEIFLIAHNNLSGVLPPFISNASRLSYIDVSKNNFRGTIPLSLGNLRFLQRLYLGENKFTRDPSSLVLEFLTPLANCKHLRELRLSSNPLNGILPESIGNLSESIEVFEASQCGISGGIPVAIGNLSNLFSLNLFDNQLIGSLPTSIASFRNLQYLSLGNQLLSGSLSCSLFRLQRLSELYLLNNMFSGAIPECIGNLTSLRILALGGNKFSSNIPMNLWKLKNILSIRLSDNLLSSSLPSQVGNLNVVTLLDLSMNNISGNIPDTIGNIQNLGYLSLSNNLFEGSIPNSIGRIVSLENLYLSKNNLSGSIPTTLEKLPYLKDLNVSHNNLVGLIPSGGPFVNFTAESFIFNKALCGDKRFHVPPCPSISPKKLWIKVPKHMLVLCFGLVSSIAAITLVSIYLIRRRKNKTQKTEELQLTIAKDRISFYELQHATDGYNERNLLGQGSFGSVYKATLRDGRVVAVKVFNLQKEGAFKSFDMECEVLRNLRHRNLIQVISSCSNLDFKAIVLEFMPNGSLENMLHSPNHFLSFTERLNIMIDVASALHYLHSGYPTPVVHADLKPSNVLLDESKVAHVSDFGIAKMLEERSITYTNTLATFGYIAPGRQAANLIVSKVTTSSSSLAFVSTILSVIFNSCCHDMLEYGSEGLLSVKSDIYSFGVMLMEVITRKSPNDEMFNESLTLHDWVHKSMDSALVEIIDDGMLNTVAEEHFTLVMDCVKMIMNVALNCTKAFPRERSDIEEVLATLNKIKLKLLNSC